MVETACTKKTDIQAKEKGVKRVKRVTGGVNCLVRWQVVSDLIVIVIVIVFVL